MSFSNIPTTAKSLNYCKKAKLIEYILAYQVEQEKSKTQLVTSEFIKPSEYICDINKRIKRNNQEVHALLKDTQNTFKAVKKVISLPSFI